MFEIEMKIRIATDGRSVSHIVSGRTGSGRLSYSSGDGSGFMISREIYPREVRCVACALLSGFSDPDSREVEVKVTERGLNRIVKECNIVPSGGDGSLKIFLRDVGTGISESMEILSSDLKCFFCFVFGEERFPEDIREVFDACTELCRPGCLGLPFMGKKVEKVPS